MPLIKIIIGIDYLHTTLISQYQYGNQILSKGIRTTDVKFNNVTSRHIQIKWTIRIPLFQLLTIR